MTAARKALQQIRCDDVAPQPWRNGGGRTRELLAWPDPSRWHCRISVAEIDADGPFSSFPGVDRWFAVVEGAGVELELPDGVHHLHPDSPPLAFPGEAAPPCTLVRGPTSDLNLMSLRSAGRARMERAVPGSEHRATAALHGCFTADPVTLHSGAAEALALPGGSLMWTAVETSIAWTIVSTLPAPRTWWLSFADWSAA